MIMQSAMAQSVAALTTSSTLLTPRLASITSTQQNLVHAHGALALNVDGPAGDIAVKARCALGLTSWSHLPLVIRQ